MNSPDEKLAEQKACSVVLLNKWRRELLIDEGKGDADAIELDRRVLDYYLDLYNSSLHEANKRSFIEQIRTANRPEQSLKRGE